MYVRTAGQTDLPGLYELCCASAGRKLQQDVFAQIFRSNGLTKVGMYISLSVNIINIIGNYIFLYGPLSFLDLGVTGVAISSVFSRFIAVIIAIYFFIKH